METSNQTPEARARILLVDDFEVVLRGLRNLLNGNKSWQVCGEAEDGQVALEKVATLEPDLVFLDVSMPGMNGFETARQIRKIAPKTKIIIFTMHESSQVAEEARLAGADTYLAKSAPMEALEETIHRLLATRNGMPA